MANNTFHLGLCMAGSISAGAYTAGVMDYLMETLERWEAARNTDESVPKHKVVIDLLGGSSGGGITAALSLFGLRDKLQHAYLEEDAKTYSVDPEKNIFWKTWVELSGKDMFGEMLEIGDVANYHIPSALNASFIDEVAAGFEKYIKDFQNEEKSKPANPSYLLESLELFMTLFNITGMKYEISNKALGRTEQYVAEHRDLAHFRWSEKYDGDGRMEISLNNLKNIKPLIQAAKATGAFPIGLQARILEREAKYIWDNPFFRKNNKFGKETIDLGTGVANEEALYKSINADGGTSNNEPVELMRDIMLQIRLTQEQNQPKLAEVESMNDTEKMVAKSEHLLNTSVILIDPFPSYNFDIKQPNKNSDNLLNYAFDLVFAMNDQLLFDAKEAFDAYNKSNYGLYVIAPSRDSAKKPQYAIACGALGGFGGFLSKEYRIHDFFLGRHNCQSFLRNYFVVNPDEEKD